MKITLDLNWDQITTLHQVLSKSERDGRRYLESNNSITEKQYEQIKIGNRNCVHIINQLLYSIENNKK